MQAKKLGLLLEDYGDAFMMRWAKKPRFISKNLEILEAGCPGRKSAGDGS